MSEVTMAKTLDNVVKGTIDKAAQQHTGSCQRFIFTIHPSR
jgi:hypothetical protein